jgi:hypothetical protein
MEQTQYSYTAGSAWPGCLVPAESNDNGEVALHKNHSYSLKLLSFVSIFKKNI